LNEIETQEGEGGRDRHKQRIKGREGKIEKEILV
jgi:hypothetical protein